MAGYTFYFRRPEGEIYTFEFANCPDDLSAMRTGRDLLKNHAVAQRVEVFNGVQVIGVSGRPGPPVSRALRVALSG